MLYRSSIGAVALLAIMCAGIGDAEAWDDAKYPDLKGQWIRIGSPRWETNDRKAPLTTEYRAIFDLASGIYGTTLDYAHRTLEELKRHDIRDRNLERLLRLIQRGPG